MVWGAVVGLIISQVVGMLWYSPLLFGNRWMKIQFPGKTSTEISSRTHAVAFPVCLSSMACMVVVLHYILGHFLMVTSVCEAVRIGLVLSAMESIIDVPHLMYAGRSGVVFIIDHLFNAVVIMEMCASIVFFD